MCVWGGGGVLDRVSLGYSIYTKVFFLFFFLYVFPQIIYTAVTVPGWMF